MQSPSRFLKSQVTRRQLLAKRLSLFSEVLLRSVDRKYCQGRPLLSLRRGEAGFARGARASVPRPVAREYKEERLVIRHQILEQRAVGIREELENVFDFQWFRTAAVDLQFRMFGI